jgi:ribosomal protein S2
MNEMRSFTETDEFAKLTKKEKSSLLRNLKKVEATYKGVKNLSKKPDLVVVVDGKLMSGLISEIEKTGVDNIIIASSNFDRYWKDENLIVANVNSYNSLDMIMNYILSA